MELVFFRHGIAQDRRSGLADADRELTERGVERTRQAARGLASVISPPDVILTSPKKRALATAQLLGGELDLVPRAADPLAEGGPTQIMKVVRDAAVSGCVVVVGHEPELSATITRLCGGASGPAVELKKAAAACVALTDLDHALRGGGTLRWLIQPRALRSLGG